jgi:hypothetical protein
MTYDAPMATRRLCLTVLVICCSSCALWLDPPMNIRIENVGDREVDVENVSATPPFVFEPVVGVLGRYHAQSGEAVREPPTHVTIAVRGAEPTTLEVPPLPDDARGEITFLITYTRSRRWVAQWEIIPARDNLRNPVGLRLIPDDEDPKFRLHRALIGAASEGDVEAAGRLLDQGAPLAWDTTAGSPLVVAASRHRNAVIERLLQDHAEKFEPVDIAAAVKNAADANDEDISTLRLLVERVGSRLSKEARGQILRNAAESHRMDSFSRMVPAGPAIRYLIEEARFDVNQPVGQGGETLLDFADIPQDDFRDKPLIEFLEAHGAKRSGRR